MFGNFASVSLLGWTGVGWVASGIYIKMNRSYDSPRLEGAALKEYESLAISEDEEVRREVPMPATQCTSPFPPFLAQNADRMEQSRTSTYFPSLSLPPSSS